MGLEKLPPAPKSELNIDELGPILWSKWLEVGGQLKGRWAEDNSAYFISCPEQLRSLIIKMKNILADKYIAYKEAKKNLEEKKSFLKNLLDNDSEL